MNGALLSHVAETAGEEEKKNGQVGFFSPVPELALFFGMTSASTDEGFSTGVQRCVSAQYMAISLQTTFYCTVHRSLPYMAFTWTENFEWLY